jgi:uncharacterized protein YyaL (SSP411 family)
MLTALDCFHGPDVEVTVACKEKDADCTAMLQLIRSKFIPDLVLRFVEEAGNDSDCKPLTGQPTAYICAGGACRPPAPGLQNLQKQLEELL